MNSEHLEEVLELIVDHITDGLNANYALAQQVANSRTDHPLISACATVVNANDKLGRIDKLQVSAAAMSDIFGLVYPVMIADGKIDTAELEVLRGLLKDSIYRYTWLGEYQKFSGLPEVATLALMLAEWSSDASPLGGNLKRGALFTPCLALAVLARELTHDDEPLSTYCQGLHLVIHMVAEALGWHEQEQVVVHRLEAMLADAKLSVFSAIDESAEQTAVTDPRDSILSEALKNLNALIGLQEVKVDLTRLANELRNRDKPTGLPSLQVPLNFVFLGNRGTGKSSVTKILADILYGTGVLETTRVVEYEGNETLDEAVRQAKEGVLYIQESDVAGAPTVNSELLESAIAKVQETNERICVVIAGRYDSVANIVESSTLLKSQFQRRIEFRDLHVSELYRLFERLCDANGYLLTPEVRGNLAILFNRAFSNRGPHFSNLRFLRNVFDTTVAKHAERLASSDSKVTKIMLSGFDECDLPFELSAGGGPYDVAASRWKVVCPECDKKFEAHIKHLGRTVRCDCGARYRCPSWNLKPDTVPNLSGYQIYEGPHDLVGLPIE